MKTKWFFAFGMLVLLALVACSADAPVDSPGLGDADSSIEVELPAQIRLDQSSSGALTVQAQLAAGTVLLEDTDLAVDETLAAELLPLWQAVQSLSESDTSAAVEIEAVLNQIQDTMRPEQVNAISEMKLTEDALTEMFEEGTISFGRGGFGAEDRADGLLPGGAGFGGGFGGGPPGGGLGGGPPGGGNLGGQGLDPDAIATRQAEFAAGDGAGFQDQAMLGAVVRLLRTKIGEVTVGGPDGLFAIVFETAADATGLTVDEIQSQMTDGTTLVEILEASGADVAAVRVSLIDMFAELPNADELNVEELADQWLGLDE